MLLRWQCTCTNEGSFKPWPRSALARPLARPEEGSGELQADSHSSSSEAKLRPSAIYIAIGCHAKVLTGAAT
eukprot:scaffold487575_cov14-Prasinocladus_malaysianus.AAC.1